MKYKPGIKDPLFLSLFFISAAVFSQSQMGLVNSNYAGLHALQINPSFIVSQPIDNEINILSAEARIANDHFYLPATNLPYSIINGNFNVQFGKPEPGKPDPPNVTKIRKRLPPYGYFFAEFNVLGPSYLISRYRRSMAFTMAYRNYNAGVNIPNVTAQTVFDGLAKTSLQGQKHNLQDIHAGSLSWVELGFSYATVLSETFRYQVKAGAGIKLLMGLSAAFFYDRGSEIYNAKDTILDIRSAMFTYGFAGSQSGSTGDALTPRGFGVSSDLGISLLRKASRKFRRGQVCPNIFSAGGNDDINTYRWKAGISLLDFGLINFGQQAKKVDIDDNAGLSWKNFDSTFRQSMFSIDEAVTGMFRKNGTATIKEEASFTMMLPTALSAQLEVRLIDRVFFNTTLIQRITYGKSPSVRRMNIVSFTPRFETAGFEISFPFSFIEYKRYCFGTCIRFKYFYIGSNSVNELFGVDNIMEPDLYFGFKYIFSRFYKISGSGF